MWAYEARRLFRDRLVGEKAVDQFDAILGSVLQSDWSASLSSLDQDGGAFYVTWGSPQSSKADGLGNPFGHPLGRLSATDMQEVVAKAVTTFGEFFLSLFSLFLSL
jgi:dynein heavy chain 2